MLYQMSRNTFLRRFALLILALGLGMVILACAGQPLAPQAPTAPTAQPPAAQATSAPAATSATSSNQPVKLTIWSGYPEMEPWYKEVTDAYTKEHPNVTFEILTFPLRDYEQKLSATIPSDTAADIIEVSSFVAKFVDAGLIPPAPDKIAEWNNAPGRYDAAIVKDLTYNGKQYAVPLFYGSTALYYNKKDFADAGLTKPPETFDELMDDAQKLTQRDASGNITVAGHGFRLFGAGSGVAEKFLFYLWPAGGDIIVPVGDKWKEGYNNDAGRWALKYYIDALYKYKVDDPKLKRDAEGFELGQSATFFRESWVIGDIKKNAPTLDYSTAPVPKGPKRWGHIIAGEDLFVTRTAKNPDVAWDFILFAVQPQYMQDLLRNVGWLPSRHDVDYGPVLKDNPQFAGFVFSDPNYQAYMTPAIPVFDEVETKMAERLIQLYTDASLLDNPDGIAKAVADMAAETNSILDKAGVLAK